jgi:Cu+-exporting ATPase
MKDSFEKEESMAKDPVCGMMIDEKKAAGNSVYKGMTYFFCAKSCKDKFDKNPGQYLTTK